jgi:hypothetical protein
MAEATPIACSLNASAYSERLEQIRAVGRGSFQGSAERGDVVQLTFADDGTVGPALEAIAEAERACCAFLGLEVRTEPGRAFLTIAGPAEARPVIRAIVDAFGGEPHER